LSFCLCFAVAGGYRLIRAYNSTTAFGLISGTTYLEQTENPHYFTNDRMIFPHRPRVKKKINLSTLMLYFFESELKNIKASVKNKV